MKLLRCAPLLVGLCCAASPTEAQDTGAVRGVVRQAGSTVPLVDAVVRLGQRATRTDDAGRFHLCRLKAGADTLVAELGLFRELRVPVLVSPTATVEVQVQESGATPAVSLPVRIREGGVPVGAIVVLDGTRIFSSTSGCQAAPPGMTTLDEAAARLSPEEIESVYVVKAAEAMARFGPDARYGALVVTTKAAAAASPTP